MTNTGTAGGNLKSKKILIVDDEPDLVAYLDALLKDNGFATAVAKDGREGMAKVKSEKPDLISLDISMPEESGVRMYRELCEDPETSKIPVVMVTGLSSDFKRFINHLERKKRLPLPAAYFEKPIGEKEFLVKIREILS